MKRAYFGALAVTAVMLPGLAGFLTSMLYLLDRKASLKLTPFGWAINDGGARSFLFGTALAVIAWLLVSLLLLRYGRVEGSNPAEYARLRSLHATLRTRHQAVPDNGALAAQLAGAALADAATALRVEGKDVSTRGIVWAAQSGYVVVRAKLEAADRAMLEFDGQARLAAAAADLRSRIDGSRIPGSAALIESIRDINTELGKDNPNLALVRAQLAQVQATVDEYRDGRRYGLVSARSSLYGAILLGGTLAYLVLGLALIYGAKAEQIVAVILLYLVGAVVGLYRQLAAAGSADTQIEEDYGLDDARLIQRPLFSGVAAVGGVALTTIAVAVAPVASDGANGGGTGAPTPATTIQQSQEQAQQQEQEQQQPREVPSLAEIYDLDKNRLAILYAAIFGLTPALFGTRLKGAAEQFKADLRSTQPSEQAGPG